METDTSALIEALDIPIHDLATAFQRAQDELPGLMLRALEQLRAGPVPWSIRE